MRMEKKVHKPVGSNFKLGEIVKDMDESLYCFELGTEAIRFHQTLEMKTETSTDESVNAPIFIKFQLADFAPVEMNSRIICRVQGNNNDWITLNTGRSCIFSAASETQLRDKLTAEFVILKVEFIIVTLSFQDPFKFTCIFINRLRWMESMDIIIKPAAGFRHLYRNHSMLEG